MSADESRASAPGIFIIFSSSVLEFFQSFCSGAGRKSNPQQYRYSGQVQAE